MNETYLQHETASSAPPPGWATVTGAYQADRNEEAVATEARDHRHLEEILEQHAQAKGNPVSVPSATDGIASQDHFSNGSVDKNHKETENAPLMDNVRPGSSLRLSRWGISAAKKLGQTPPRLREETLAYPRSNALVRRYAQWHVVHPH